MLLAERIKGEICQLSRSRKGKWETAEEDHKDKGTMSIEQTTAKFLSGPGTWNDSGRKSKQPEIWKEEAESPDAAQRIVIWIQPVNCLLKEKTKIKTQCT